MKRLAIFTLLVLGSVAHAQTPNPVTTQPKGVTTLNSSGTIAVTNTFQSIWPKSTNVQGRLSCTVQNTGSNTMYVFFGPLADATAAKSVSLSAGQSVSCLNGVVVLQDQVSITGVGGETFYAAQQ